MSFKALTDRLPTYLQELFIKCNNDNYYLRSNNSKLALPNPKTNFLKRSFSYRAAQGWNKLPNSKPLTNFPYLRSSDESNI